jgi:hypothetical protein
MDVAKAAVTAQAVRVANAVSDAPVPATIVFATASHAMIDRVVMTIAGRRANSDLVLRRRVKIPASALPSVWPVPVLLRAAKQRP